MCIGAIDLVFEDKRLASVILLAWLAIVVCVFSNLGLLDSAYVSFGPSPKTVFMTVVLDTWTKWGLVAGFTFVNTCMNDFFSDAISPWLLNTVIDHKSRYLNYPKWVCLAISQVRLLIPFSHVTPVNPVAQVWAIYCAVMSVLGLMIALSQVDFVLIRLIADLLVNTYTNMRFMKGKSYDPSNYYRVEEAQTLQLFSISEEPGSPR